MAPDRPEPTIFSAWMTILSQKLFKDELGGGQNAVFGLDITDDFKFFYLLFVPVVVLGVVAQQHIVKGLTVGAVKGGGRR